MTLTQAEAWALVIAVFVIGIVLSCILHPKTKCKVCNGEGRYYGAIANGSFRHCFSCAGGGWRYRFPLRVMHFLFKHR